MPGDALPAGGCGLRCPSVRHAVLQLPELSLHPPEALPASSSAPGPQFLAWQLAHSKPQQHRLCGRVYKLTV